MTIKLNLGCGNEIMEGFTNVDIAFKKGVKLWDLNKYPLPWKDDSVDYIFCSHTLEHLERPLDFILELHRISKDGTIIDLYVPHFTLFGTYAELTHKMPGASYFTFGYADWNKELNGKFKVMAKLNFTRSKFKWLNYIFNPLINFSPLAYERFFCYLLPCSEIQFKLEVIKTNEKEKK